MNAKSLSVLAATVLTALSLKADFYVIPVVKEVRNVIHVAKSGAKYTDPIAAMNSIDDAAANNRYTIEIGEGDYNLSEPLTVKAYVDIKGAGIAKTKLEGAFLGKGGYDSYAVKLSGHTMLTQLSVENSADPEADNSTVKNMVTGVYASQCSGIVLREVNITAKNRTSKNYLDGGRKSVGLYLEISSATLANVGLYSEGGYRSYAVFNNRSLVDVMESNITASDGYSQTFALHEAGGDLEASALVSASSLLAQSDNGETLSVNLEYNSTMHARSSKITGVNNSEGRCYLCTTHAGVSLDGTCQVP